eukprot:scaffold102134_cov51-Phaeocystis_antarctica.AAC.1
MNRHTDGGFGTDRSVPRSSEGRGGMQRRWRRGAGRRGRPALRGRRSPGAERPPGAPAPWRSPT